MRTAFPCLIVEVTNDSVFFKQAKIVGLVSLCILFAFYSILSFFSSQGHFCMSYLLMLSGVAAGKLREDFTEWRRESLAGFTLEPLQSRAICQFLPSLLTALKVFKAKIKKNPFFHFTFNSTGRSHTYDSTVFIEFFNEIIHNYFLLSVMTLYGFLKHLEAFVLPVDNEISMTKKTPGMMSNN